MSTQTIQNYTKQIDKLLSQNNFAPALVKAEEFYQQQPRNPDSSVALGLCHSLVGNHVDSIVWNKKVAEQNHFYFNPVVSNRIADSRIAIQERWIDNDVYFYNAVDDCLHAASCYPEDIYYLLCAVDIIKFTDANYAITLCQQAMVRQPDNYLCYLSKAVVYKNHLYDFAKASVYYEKALELAKQSNQADKIKRMQWECAMFYLTVGDFEKAWPCFQIRLEDKFKHTIYDIPLPLWQGEDLSGKTLILHGEQGYGDDMMFASIYREIIEYVSSVGGKVIIVTTEDMQSLYQRSFPVAQVVGLNRNVNQLVEYTTKYMKNWLASLGGADYQISGGSLPLLRRLDLQSFANKTPYLKPCPNLSAKFSTILDKEVIFGKKKVGLVWHGNMSNTKIAPKKSIPISALSGLSDLDGCQLISLQLTHTEQVLDNLPELDVLRMGEHLQNFDDTAALVSQMDLVVTMDTAVAHLCGAMGVPVLVLLRRSADWRYLTPGTQKCYWYDSMHLLWQQTEGDWPELINRSVNWISNYFNHEVTQ